MSTSRGFFILLVTIVLSATAPPRAVQAAEVQATIQHSPQATAGAAARFVYGASLTGIGFALIPITTEAIIDRRLDPELSGGLWASALVLGVGGIPMMATAARGLGNGTDPLSGPRARYRMAREGVLPYALIGSLFSGGAIVLTSLAVAREGAIPLGVHVFNGASMTLLGTAVGLAIDGDLARWLLPAGERRDSLLDDLGLPMMITGILLLVAATPAMRLGLYKDGMPLEASYVPMAGGIGFTGFGVISLVLQRAIKEHALRAGRGGSGPTIVVAPTVGGVGISGRF